MKKKKKIKTKEPLYFVSYHIHTDRQELQKFFSTRWVRCLNIDQEELCKTLQYIEGYKHLINTDGTLVVGRDLTILPSETMDMEMDVNEEFVNISDNQLYYKPKDGEEKRPMIIRDYLYGFDHYIMSCWESSKKEEFREMRKNNWGENEN